MFTPPKTAVIKLSELRPDLSLLPRHYIESDLDRVTRELRAKHPGKTVRVCDNHNGTYKVSLTEHFTVNIRGERA